MALPRRSSIQRPDSASPDGMPSPQLPQPPVQKTVPQQGMSMPDYQMSDDNVVQEYGQQSSMPEPQFQQQDPSMLGAYYQRPPRNDNQREQSPSMQGAYPDASSMDFSQDVLDLPQDDQLFDDSSWSRPQQAAVYNRPSQPQQAVTPMARPVQGIPYMGGQPAVRQEPQQQPEPSVDYNDNHDLAMDTMDPLAGPVSDAPSQDDYTVQSDYSEYTEPDQRQVVSNTPDDAGWEQKMNDSAIASIDQKARAAEERAVENMEKREARDIRSARRSRKSKIQPNAAVDALKKANTIRMITVFIIMAILALAVFNVLMPKKQYSVADIQSIAQTASGDTGFPLQEGSGIAQQFIQAYIQSGSASDQLLSVFYNGMTMASVTGGDGTTGSQSNNITNPSTIEQDIQYGPYVYEEQAVAADGSSATYKVGTLVYRKNTIDGSIITSSDGKTPLYRWLFYQVDVYYDKDKDMFTVSSDSPTRVTEPRMSQGNAAPDADLPGDKEEKDDLENDSMQNLITQFFSAWGKSDDTALSVIIDKKESKPSVNFNKSDNVGLGGAVELAGDPSYKIYGPPATDKYYRALVTVQWKETIDENNAYTQTSKYVLKLKKSGTGSEAKFYVIDVHPYLYMPASKTTN